MEPYNQRFQELAEDVLETIKVLELEIVAYQYALQRLQTSFLGSGSAASFFQSALEEARHSLKIQKDLENKKQHRLALFQGMPNVPIDPKMDALRQFLESFRKEISAIDSSTGGQ
jgi:hypothetical protein